MLHQRLDRGGIERRLARLHRAIVETRQVGVRDPAWWEHWHEVVGLVSEIEALVTAEMESSNEGP
jgi:hypothetical protein